MDEGELSADERAVLTYGEQALLREVRFARKQGKEMMEIAVNFLESFLGEIVEKRLAVEDAWGDAFDRGD